MTCFKRTALLAIAGVVVCAIALFAGCSGGAGSSYALNRDKSLSTDWGAIIQFKVDEKWETTTETSSDDSATVLYSDKTEGSSGDNYVFISIDNPNGILYKYDSTKTYSDWIEQKEDYYSQTPEEQAAWYKDNMKDYADADPEMAKAEFYPTYSDFSLEEIGSADVDGNDFRLYKMKYTVTYSDSRIAELKEKNPDYKQTEQYDVYYGIIKDGSHDMEISAGSEKLLKDFLGTCEIKW